MVASTKEKNRATNGGRGVEVMCLSGSGKVGHSLNGAGLATEVSLEHRLKEGFVCLSVSYM